MISKLQYITQGATPKEHLENIQNACASGAEWIQLRLKNVSKKVLLDTAQKAREITEHYQTRLIINDHYKIAKEVKADGVHLGKKDVSPTIARDFLYSWQIIGGTANTLDDCKKMISKKVDYIGLGPYQFTETKENLSPVLGITGYKVLIEELQTEIPVIAIGGIKIADTKAILETGVYGVAVSGEITRNFNLIPSFHDILKAPSVNEQVFKLGEQKNETNE